MTTQATERYHAEAPPQRGRGGFTLLEVLLSTVIVVILLTGVVSSMFVAQGGMAASSAKADCLTLEQRATQMIAQDVSLATSFTERTSLAVTMVVPDRNSDGQSETIRYAWSGVPGAPLTRQYNGGTPAVLAANVTQFNLAYLLKTLNP